MSLLPYHNSERMKKLKAKLDVIPEKPGVYLHKNAKNEILYVGKAKNLRARLKSYFTSPDQQTIKTRALVEKIVDYEVIVTETEYESLLLENNLIKHNMPPYNILLRDDKTYPYLKIDTQEQWPRVTLARKRKKDGSLYFGPYTIAGQVTQLLGVINRFFPLVKCTPAVFKNVTRPCNYYDIKKCLGPCKIPVNPEEYQTHLSNVVDILNGKTLEISKKIKQEMLKSAEEHNFEKAALLRDQYQALLNLDKSQSVTLDLPLILDVVSYSWSDDLIVFYVTSIREGKLIGGNASVLKEVIFEPGETNTLTQQENIISSFLCQYYAKKEIPDLIYLYQCEKIITLSNFENIDLYFKDKKLTSKNEAKQILYFEEDSFFHRIKYDFDISKINEYKKIFHDIFQLSSKNAENKFQEQIKINESSSLLLKDLKQLLNLSFLPREIECYDISTFQGSQTVASQVLFKDGAAYKSGYRKYIIKEVIGKSDDFASLREVMRRRFKDPSHLPDLIVIDGGTPQIREVGWVLKSIGLGHIQYIGIAKSRIKNSFHNVTLSSSQERIVIPKRDNFGNVDPSSPPETLSLKEGSPAYRLLTQMRDEAHRFAITFHRSKRDAKSIQSVLLHIPGLGPKRRKQLLDVCPNIYSLKELDLNDVSQKTKIPLKFLQELMNKISEN